MMESLEKIDLHMHSNYSDDADLPVAELISRCKAHGITTLAVTDHNSANSVAEASALADNTLRTISGIEIDCTFDERNYHLLGYGFTPSDDFSQIHRNFSELQRKLMPKKIEALRHYGFIVDEDALTELAGERIPQEEQMAEVILADDRNKNNPLLLPYRSGGSRSDMPLINFFWDFFGAGRPCYIPVSYPAMEQMVDVIRSNGGTPVIAHIGANIKQQYQEVLTGMQKVGVMGIEVFSSYHSPELEAWLYDFALNQNLHVTCGSDFHGHNKPKIEVGQCCYNASQLTAIRRFTDSLTV